MWRQSLGLCGPPLVATKVHTHVFPRLMLMPRDHVEARGVRGQWWWSGRADLRGRTP